MFIVQIACSYASYCGTLGSNAITHFVINVLSRQFRLTAYRHFLEWVLQGERLGRGRRVVLPACVAQAIRQPYPAPDGQYCGHQEVEDAQEEFPCFIFIQPLYCLYSYLIKWLKCTLLWFFLSNVAPSVFELLNDQHFRTGTT